MNKEEKVKDIKKIKVKLEKEETLMGRFQKERTEAISEMFDNVDENGIYPTTRFFIRLDNAVKKIIKEWQGEQKEYEEIFKLFDPKLNKRK